MVGVVHPGDGVGLGAEISVIAHVHIFLLLQNYEKKGLVPKKRSSNISHFCKQLHFCHLKPSKETLLTFILMATRFPAASYVNVRAFCADKGDDRDARMVHDVKYGIMLFIRIIAFLIIY